jgi:transposase
MKRKRTYRAEAVEQVRIEALLPLLVAGCIVALDVAKQKFLVALATLTGEVVKLFRFEHPTETRKFLEVVTALRAGVEPGKLKVAMEPTGTYGDAIRHQLVGAAVPVWMVSPKRTHDSQELFDNVRSLHDPKSAVLVAKLCGMGLASEWKTPSETRTRLRALVELRQHERRHQEMCFGRIESVLARHWPEFGRWMDVREQKSALRLLATYSSPTSVQAEPEVVRSFLREVSRARLSAETMAGVIADARTTLGVPMLQEQERLLRTLATHALDAGRRCDDLERDMHELAKHDDVFARLSSWMGTYTAAVVVTLCDPSQYANARQLEKACGLNLREKSSGEHQGRLSITKRGPGLVRQVLYLFALRMIQESSAVRAWYMRRRGFTDESKLRAVVAVIRKLVRALFHVAKGAAFEEGKLFDLRRLDLDAVKTTVQKKEVTPRTTPRAIARGTKRTRNSNAAAASM